MMVIMMVIKIQRRAVVPIEREVAVLGVEVEEEQQQRRR